MPSIKKVTSNIMQFYRQHFQASGEKEEEWKEEEEEEEDRWLQ